MASRTSVQDVIDTFRASTNVARGERFERLMVDYLHLDPTLSVEYDLVERWPDWAHNEGTLDSGIDLVARNKETGEWAAAQCKFLDPKHTRAAVIDNPQVALGGIPAEKRRYLVASRSAPARLIDHYQVKTDRPSGAGSDPNKWCRDHDDLWYVVDPVKCIVRVPTVTPTVVDALSDLPLTL